MNLNLLNALGNFTQARATTAKAPQATRVSSTESTQASPANDRQTFQAAKTRQAQQFQGKGSVQTQLSNLALLAEQSEGSQPLPSKRVQNVESDPVDNRIGGFFKKMKQVSTLATAPQQLGDISEGLQNTAPLKSSTNQQRVQSTSAPRQQSTVNDSSRPTLLSGPQKSAPKQAVKLDPKLANSAYTTATEPVRAALPTKNISDQQTELVGEKLQDNIKAAFKSKPADSPEGKYYRLTKLLHEYAVYQQTGGGPLAGDEDALRLVESNLHFMQTEVKKLAQDPGVKKVFQDAHQQALSAVFGSNYPEVAQQYANHLLSDGFQAQLSKLSPKVQQAEMAKAMLKLASLDPKLAEETLDKLVVKQLNTQFQAQLKAGDPKAQSGLEATIEHQFAEYIKEKYPHVSKSDDIRLLKAEFSKRLKALIADDPQALKKLMSPQGFAGAMKEIGQALKKTPGIPAALANEANEMVKGMTKATVHGTLMSKAALFTGLYSISQAKNSEEFLSGLSSVMQGGSKLSALGHLAGLASEARLMKGLVKMGMLGPIGEALGVASDIMGAIRESDNEDLVGMAAKITSAAAGTVGGLAGLAILAGASGPAAPFVVLGAAVVGAGATVADMFFAESDKTGELRTTLRDVGISTSMAEVYKKVDASLGVVWDNPNDMQKEFKKLKTPMERAAFINRVLDRKSIWISAGRADMVVGMLNSLSDAELKEVTQNGLHTGMLGRILGEFPEAAGKILGRLDRAWQKGDEKMAKQVNQFIKGIFEGGHHESFKTIMENKSSKAIIHKMSNNQVKELIVYLGELKSADNSKERMRVAYTEHGQSLFYLLNNASWEQFNGIFGGEDGRQMADQIRHQIGGGNNDHLGLEGKIAAWANDPRTDKAARRNILNVFSEQLKYASGSNASRLADGFMSLMDPEQLKALPSDLRHRLHLAYEYGHSYSEENYDRLKAHAPDTSVE